MRLLNAEKRRLERDLDRARGELNRQGARLKQLEREARARGPQSESAVAAQAAELDQWREKAAALQQDVYNSTHLLELAKQELDKQKKTNAELRTQTAVQESDARRLPDLQDECRRAREAADRMQHELAAARAERETLQNQVRAREAEQVELRETNLRLQADLARMEDMQARAAAAHRDEIRDLTARLAAGEAASRPPSWYLKLDAHTILGPTDQDELYAWACDCRLGPDHLLSRDRQAWMPARELPSLHMEWMVELIDGSRFGPLNVFAVQHLLGDGSVRPEAQLKHVRTGMVCKALDVASPDIVTLRQEHQRAVAELAALRRGWLAAQARIDAQETSSATPAPPKALRDLIRKRQPPAR